MASHLDFFCHDAVEIGSLAFDSGNTNSGEAQAMPIYASHLVLMFSFFVFFTITINNSNNSNISNNSNNSNISNIIIIIIIIILVLIPFNIMVIST